MWMRKGNAAPMCSNVVEIGHDSDCSPPKGLPSYWDDATSMENRQVAEKVSYRTKRLWVQNDRRHGIHRPTCRI